MRQRAPLVRHEVRETSFGLYTWEEIQAVSVCKITCATVYDGLGNVLQGGLYDPRMGCLQSLDFCVTCGLGGKNCPGHPGHIELDVPVYHPLLFQHLFQLLRASCSFCHKLRMSDERCRKYLIRLKLLEMDEVELAATLNDRENTTQVFEDAENTAAKDFADTLAQFEQRFALFCRRQRGRNYSPTAAAKRLQEETIEAFQKEARLCRTCENCSALSPPYRKDGHSKIFRKPPSKRMLAEMKAKRRKMTSALAMADDNDAGTDDDDDDGDEDDDGGEEAAAGSKQQDKFITPKEVEAEVKSLWAHSTELLEFIWAPSLRASSRIQAPQKDGYQVFFVKCLLVPANRFRPESHIGEAATECPQNSYLTRIISGNDAIRRLESDKDKAGDGEAGVRMSDSDSEESIEEMAVVPSSSASKAGAAPAAARPKLSYITKLVKLWVALQDSVNCFMDSTKDPSPLGKKTNPPGIRQVLERKEGMFRMNMMGKRVNHCCRSVISPDPYLGMNEVGVPKHFAMTLVYPEPVNDFNAKHLRTLVERGSNEYPGANILEKPDGQQFRLDKMTPEDRAAKAKLLLNEPGYKVYRHLINGDMLLMNRQPSLHKPSIMAHKARVLTRVKEQTLRMNYANCNAYNADFDGDEMNCHFVQNEIARAEANFICNTENQYIVPTSGNPLRGLIQDHVASGVKLTCRDTFLTRQQFQQLLYVAVCGLEGTELVTHRERLHTPRPAVLRPQERWTGKQVITALLACLCKPPLPKLNLDGKTRTPPTALGAENSEHLVLFRNGELLMGVMDKASIGNVSLGIVHAVYELYGAEFAGKLLTAFGRLFTYHLQNAGHTCGIEDLTLTAAADKERAALLQVVSVEAEHGLRAFLDNAEPESGEVAKAELSDAQRASLEGRLALKSATHRRDTKVALDGMIQGVINKAASNVIKVCLPNGLETPFLRNNFSIMVLTGAKGSSVNQSQISCFLGQQALEGQRVPQMVSGKTLPSFRAYDTSARAGGFVQDRFLTGVKPQEYYFHCMAGREGLVDTAVKTSRSGYLQRCLVKHLEELQVQYDYTVRDSGGNVIQFLYGEDGIDPMCSNLLRGQAAQMTFMARNHEALEYQYNPGGVQILSTGIDVDKAEAMHKFIARAHAPPALGASGSQQPEGTLACLAAGSVVQARRKKTAALPWSRSNMLKTWMSAEVIKVRQARDSEGGGSKKSSAAIVSVDLLYMDGVKEKKVPLVLRDKSSITAAQIAALESASALSSKSSSSSKSAPSTVSVPLIRLGLPDPVMSLLPLGQSLGAVSEKMQAQIDAYCRSNPDRAIRDKCDDPAMVSLSSQCSPEEMQLLAYLKYMRSLAAPGEAVGCVAAQSVGEPSTQMTLNTFHLAGHGGANVTLGIPRLREIIMTASKSLSTPTMLLPLRAGATMVDARALARYLGRLPLSQLLSHKGGIEVGEAFTPVYGSATGQNGWQRRYRVKLLFESHTSIDEVYGVSFEALLEHVRRSFAPKLNKLAGKSVDGGGGRLEGVEGGDVSTYRGKDAEGKASKDKASKGNDDDASVGSANSQSQGGKMGKGGKEVEKDIFSDSSDDEEDEEKDEEDGMQAIGGKREVRGYDKDDEAEGKGQDDDDDDDDDDDEGVDDMEVQDDDDEEDIFADPSDFPSKSKKAKAANGNSKTTKKINATKATNGAAASARSPKSKAASSTQDLMGVVGNEEESSCEFTLSFPAASRRLLMAQLAEALAEDSTVRVTKGVQAAYPVACDKNSHGFEGCAVLTEGVAFEEIWRLHHSPALIDFNAIASNDIHALLLTYGVEAARVSIVNEIIGVFRVYGIDVNTRHLNLIADFMTRSGGYTAMNRMGMAECESPFQQMSFESTCTFLTKVALQGGSDKQASPSSRIVLGSVPLGGTGCFQLLTPLA